MWVFMSVSYMDTQLGGEKRTNTLTKDKNLSYAVVTGCILFLYFHFLLFANSIFITFYEFY